MLNAGDIGERIAAVIESRGCFLVDVEVSGDNDVTVTIESSEGTVTMDDCAAVNDFFLSAYDQDTEDYSLTVTSAGLDQPFRIRRQLAKAVGKEVEVRLLDGSRLTGTLTEETDGHISLSIPGGRKKAAETETVPTDEIKDVRYHISI